MTAWLAAAVLFAAPARGKAHDTLHQQCLLYAADPKNPWALAHGITALGPKFAAADGRVASQVIVGDFLKKGGPPEGNPYSFDRYAPDRTPIEPHSNLQVKTLVLAGVPLTTSFPAPFGKVTLQELLRGVERGFRHVPQNEAYWREVAWTLDLLSATRTPAKASFQHGGGEAVDFQRVMDDALTYLESAQQEIAEGMDKGLARVDKRKQGIYAHTCGGLHLFQAVASWARFAEVKKKWGKRLDRQIDVLFYRLDSEAKQYEEALQKAPQYKLQLLTQMVKFYGHFLETTGRLKVENRFVPSKAQRQQIAKAKALLDWAVRELEAQKAFASMEQLKASQPQIYLDLIGDACHAAHGLAYWK
ncbi:MAG: hypothetical protein ACOZIN_07845 [Myxococcota bacterium]